MRLGEKSWADLYCWKLAEFLRKHPSLKGVYYDCWGGQCYEQDGYMFPTFETRELHKRMYLIIKKAIPDAWIIYHTSYLSGMPMASFGDITMGGEHYTAALLKHPYYLEFTSLDQLRVDLAAPLGPANAAAELLPGGEGAGPEAGRPHCRVGDAAQRHAMAELHPPGGP